MRTSNVITITQYRKSDQNRRRNHLNAGKRGRVYSRGGRLWVDFHYFGERVREPSGLDDNQPNRLGLRRQLDLIMAEIENGVFEFAKRFPHSKRKVKFSMLEGRTVRKGPEEIFFKDYVSRWWDEMAPGMSASQIRDYTSILKNHHLPYFSELSFFEICSSVRIKKFVASLKSKTSRFGKPLSAKRIHNIIIPLRVIVKDAIDEYGWTKLPDPFAGLKLPQVRKIRVHPFAFDEWSTLMEVIPLWYRPYFEFAVQTGLRTSEQVALKWEAIDEEFIHIELSRVRNIEKTDLKTEESRRRIKIRPSMKEILRIQKSQAAHFNSDYVFLNTKGRPCLQDSLRWHWVKAMKKSGLPFRRMYETRHTFASWALSKGETPEWVARTLGHVDTSMIYRTYSRYIPNLTRQDGSALEELFTETVNKKGDPK